jgi:hypothetical protein
VYTKAVFGGLTLTLQLKRDNKQFFEVLPSPTMSETETAISIYSQPHTPTRTSTATINKYKIKFIIITKIDK